MKLSSLVKRYNEVTGEEYSTYVESGWICDYCGNFHDPKTEEDRLQPISYSIYESDEIESQFSQEEVKGHPEVNVYDLFGTHPQFTYCQDIDANIPGCEYQMIAKWIRNLVKKNKEFSNCSMLCQVMYEARVRMLKEVLDEKLYTFEQLKLSR